MGALLLLTQVMTAPVDLLNLSLNASAVAPEGMVLIALLGTLIVDLAGEKAAAKWAPPICYVGLTIALLQTKTAYQKTMKAFPVINSELH